jgi:hypothetical protein
VAELSDGFEGKLARQQTTYMILDAMMVGIAGILLTVFHPGVCFQEYWNIANFNVRSKKRNKADVEKESATPPYT